MRFWPTFTIAIVLTPCVGWAQAPQLVAVFPPGGAVGTKVSARIEGANLAGATSILISEPGVTIQNTGDGKDAGAIPVTLDVASDAMPGPREIRVITPKGASNPAYLWVGALPEIPEKEPNDQQEQAQTLDSLPLTVYGRANAPEDVDWFSFKAAAGETFVFESCSFRIFSAIDCFLELRDERGRFLPPVGSEGYDRDPRIIYTFKKSGTYRLQVRDLSYRGGPGFVYRISIGKLPVLTSIFPRGGRAGQKLAAKVEGVNIGAMDAWSIDLPADPPAYRAWYVSPPTPNGPALPVELGVDRNPQFLEPGPSAPGRPHSLPALPVTVNGVLLAGDETDHYRFQAAAGQPVRIRVSAREIRSRLDAYLRIFDASGKELLNSEEQVGRDPELTFNPPSAGLYRLQVAGIDGRGSPDYYYRITLAPPGPPEFSLSASPDLFLLGRGQTLLLNINAERRNFGGEILVKVDGLPRGVAASPLTLGPGQSSGIITLTAAPDIPLASSQVKISAEAVMDRGKVVESALSVGSYPRPGEGQPIARPVAFTMASATDSIPLFSLAPESTRVEIMPGQRIELKIRAARKPGDNNANPAIALTLANLPAGIKAETPNIPEKQGEVIIKLIAPEDAKPGAAMALLTGKIGENSQPAPAIQIIVKPKA